MGIHEKLINVQSELKAPKNQRNRFGGFNYRSCEDIFEAAKPILIKHGLTLTVCDEIVQLGDRFYIKATASVIDIETNERIDVAAFARESESKKGMDLAQVTGSTSSYARKYALNGLFLIDDTKDSDTTNEGDGEKVREVNETKLKAMYKLANDVGLTTDETIKTIKSKYKVNPEEMTMVHYNHTIKLLNGLKKEDE